MVPRPRSVARTTWRDTATVALLAAGLYIGAGTLGAYLARDDFNWLIDARDLGLGHAFILKARGHFYRPVAEMWWVGARQVCGAGVSCYHLLELLLHVANGVLLLFLTVRVFGRRDVALAAAVLFVVMPSYVEAVLWVCAVTTLFGACCYLLALHFALTAARDPAKRAAFWAAVGCAAAAVYSHEAMITLLATIPLVAWSAGTARRPRVAEIVPFAVLAAALAATTIVANRRNYVFVEGHYAPGVHVIGHALDYLRSLYVGSGAALELTIVAVCAVLIVFRGNRPMRAGLMWIVITMPPYLGFTWGNVGRYTYLPAIGFTWILAGVIVAARDAIDRRVPSRAAVGTVTAVLLVLAIAGRYAAFTQRAIRAQVRSMEAYRTYADRVVPQLPPNADEVDVPPPDDPAVEREFVAPMLSWRTNRPGLRVRFTDPPKSATKQPAQ
jgi:hypothetical protein